MADGAAVGGRTRHVTVRARMVMTGRRRWGVTSRGVTRWRMVLRMRRDTRRRRPGAGRHTALERARADAARDGELHEQQLGGDRAEATEATEAAEAEHHPKYKRGDAFASDRCRSGTTGKRRASSRCSCAAPSRGRRTVDAWADVLLTLHTT